MISLVNSFSNTLISITNIRTILREIDTRKGPLLQVNYSPSINRRIQALIAQDPLLSQLSMLKMHYTIPYPRSPYHPFSTIVIYGDGTQFFQADMPFVLFCVTAVLLNKNAQEFNNNFPNLMECSRAMYLNNKNVVVRCACQDSNPRNLYKLDNHFNEALIVSNRVSQEIHILIWHTSSPTSDTRGNSYLELQQCRINDRDEITITSSTNASTEPQINVTNISIGINETSDLILRFIREVENISVLTKQLFSIVQTKTGLIPPLVSCVFDFLNIEANFCLSPLPITSSSTSSSFFSFSESNRCMIS